MDELDRQSVIDIIDQEGFYYTFAHFTSFEDIRDKKFHELRNAFLDARNALLDYLDFDEESVG